MNACPTLSAAKIAIEPVHLGSNSTVNAGTASAACISDSGTATLDSRRVARTNPPTCRAGSFWMCPKIGCSTAPSCDAITMLAWIASWKASPNRPISVSVAYQPSTSTSRISSTLLRYCPSAAIANARVTGAICSRRTPSGTRPLTARQ